MLSYDEGRHCGEEDETMREVTKAALAAGLALALAACDRAGGPADKAAEAPGASDPASQALAPAATELVLACDGPINGKTTMADLEAMFGKAALTQEAFNGPEGTTAPATVLFKDDAARKASVIWEDETRTRISSVVVQGPEGTGWRGPKGLKLGSTLQEVQAANGRPFQLYGFDWDYGGRVSDLKAGALAPAGTGCTQQFEFEASAENYESAMGDSTFDSSDPRMVAARPVVTEFGIGFPLEG